MIIKTNSGKEVINRLRDFGLLRDGGTETLFYVKHDFIVDGYDPEDPIDGLPSNHLYEQGDEFTYDDYEHIVQMAEVRLLLVGFQCFDESQDEAIPLSMHDLRENGYLIDERSTTAIVENETGVREPAPCDKETDCFLDIG